MRPRSLTAVVRLQESCRTRRLNPRTRSATASTARGLRLLQKNLERAKGIEPSYEAWEASVLPLNYARFDATLNTARDEIQPCPAARARSNS